MFLIQENFLLKKFLIEENLQYLLKKIIITYINKIKNINRKIIKFICCNFIKKFEND